MDNRTAKKGRGFIDYIRSGFLVRCLIRFTDFIYRGMKKSAVGTWLTGACEEDGSAAAKQTLLSRLRSKLDLKNRIIIPTKQKLNGGISQSVILSFIRNFLSGLLQLHMKFYGVFLFSFGLFTAGTALAVRYGFNSEYDWVLNACVGAALIVFSLPAIFSSKQLSEALKESGIIRLLVGRFAGFPIDKLEVKPTKVKTNTAFVIGALLGLCTYFVNPIYIVCGFAALICAYLVLCQPESGVVGIFLLLPFVPTMVLAALIIFVALCYLCKLMQGKRVLKLYSTDWAAVSFLFIVLLGGIISVSPAKSLKASLMYVCLACGYFLAVNLLRTLAWVYRAITAALTSTLIVSAIGIYEYYFGNLQMKWLDTELFTDIEGRVVSTFDNPNVLGEYLIMVLPFALALFFACKKPRAKLLSCALFAVIGGCVIFTWSRGAWLGILGGIAIFMLVYSKRVMSFFLVCLLGVPFLPSVLPAGISSRLFSIGNLADTSTSYRVNIWKGTFNMLSDYWFTGIGVSPDAFKVVYPDYSLPGIDAAPHSHNLYLQILTETGIVGLLVFVLFVCLLLRSAFTFWSHRSYDRTPMKFMSMAGTCGLIAVLVQGMTDHIWYNYRVFAMFWLCAGLLCAIHRSGYSEYPPARETEPSVELEY